MDARLRRDVVWNLVPVALLGVVGLGLNFAIARWWGAGALGVFNLVTVTYFVAAVIGAWSIQYSLLRAVAERPGDREHVAAVVVGGLVPGAAIAAGTTLVFVLARGLVGSILDSDDVAVGMLWAAPGLFCFVLNKFLLNVTNGLRRMRAFAVYTSLRYVLIAASLLGLYATHVRAAYLAVIWSFTEGGLLLVLVGELLATVSLARCAGWRTWARTHLVYGARGVTATLAYEINTKLDVWMVGAAGISKELVGVYSLAAALNEGATQLAVVVQNNLNPMIAAHLAAGERDQVEALVRRTRRWFVPLLAGACLLGALAFPYVIPLVIGDSLFARGAAGFGILMAGLALASPYLPFVPVLLMGNRPGSHTQFMVVVVSINLVAQLVAIPHLGITGAGLATSIAVVSSAVLVRGLARHALGVRL